MYRDVKGYAARHRVEAILGLRESKCGKLIVFSSHGDE